MILALSALLTGTPPQPASGQPILAEKDVCVLAGQSVTRLGENVGDRSQVDQAVQRTESLQNPLRLRFRQKGLRVRGPWAGAGSRCRRARVADTLLGSGGDCYFHATPAGWALIGCAHSWSV